MPDVAGAAPLSPLVDADDRRLRLRVDAEPCGERLQRRLPELVLLLVAAERETDLGERILGAHQHLALRHRRAVLVAAENVIQPANMWPSGVMNVNDTSSA